MSFIKRAGLYVIRQKAKSLILFLLLVIMSTFVLAGIAIQDSASEAAKDVRSYVGGKIILAVDMSEKNMNITQSEWGYDRQYVGDLITDKTLAALKEIPGVVDYNYYSSPGIFAAAVNFEYLPAMVNMGPTEYGANSTMTTVLFSEKYSGFTSGYLKLVEGRHIVESDRNVIMISKELADYNDLSVGDKLQLYIEYTDKIVEREIIGIFTGTEGTGEDAITVSSRPGNQGFVDAKASLDSYGPEYDNMSSLELYVADPEDIENVYNRIAEHPEIKGKTFTLSIDSEEYDIIANPLESLEDIVRVIIVITIVVSVAILALLLTLWARSRVKETGILISIGVSKLNIIFQYVAEVILIAIFAFGLSYFIGNAIVDATGDFLLAQTIDAESLNQDDKDAPEGDYRDYFSQLTGVQTMDTVKDIDINISVYNMIHVYILGTFIVVVSVMIASNKILKLKPKEILSKMS